jgi:hypothetical protein
MTTIKKSLPLLLFLLLLTACGKPVPADKSAYIGEWQAPETYLLITPQGRVVYKHRKDGTTTITVKGPLQGFEGDNFTVGYAFFTTTFRVDSPPFLNDDGTWRMVVDGVELVRTRKLRPGGKSGIMV